MTQPLLPGLLPLPCRSRPPETEAAQALIHYPDVPGRLRAIHAKRLGAAGERLVDSLLLRWGFHPVEAPEAEPFDRFLPVGGDLLRLQVKTVTHPRDGVFDFPLQQGYRRGLTGRRVYAAGAFDLAALVVLPENVVLFVPEGPDRHGLPVGAIATLRARPQASFVDTLDRLRARRDAAR